MEGAPLNKAHQEVRRAEAFLKQGKWDECLQCYKDAVSYFTEAMTKTENPIALASLNAQKEHSEKQLDLIMKKKAYCENYKKMITEQRQNKKINLNNLSNVKSDEPLQSAIFRKIEEHDSLIYSLVKKGNASDSESLKSYSDLDEKNVPFDVIEYANQAIGCKLPKNDGTTIEELNILSTQLKDLIQQLLIQLEDRNKEIDLLKSRIRQLESEKHKAEQKNNNLRVATDSSGGTSPYVFSPCSEYSPDVQPSNSIPPLPPLELPSLYYSFKTTCSLTQEEKQN